MTRVQVITLCFAYLSAAASWGGFTRYLLPAPLDLITASRDETLVALSPSQPPEGSSQGTHHLAARIESIPASPPPQSGPAASGSTRRRESRPRRIHSARTGASSLPEINAYEDRLAVLPEAQDNRSIAPASSYTHPSTFRSSTFQGAHDHFAVAPVALDHREFPR